MPDGHAPETETSHTETSEAVAAGTIPGITPGRRKWLILTSVSLGTFMATLDGSIVNISLPKIQEAFGVSLSTIEWVVVAYLLIRGALLLPFGRLGDMLGYKRVYLAGFALFTCASALCGSSVSVWMLVGVRIVQAVGGSMLSSMGPAIVTRTFGSRERGKALGLNSMSVSVGLSVGPTLGGILTEFGSWRWIFYINVPVGIVAILWAWRILPDERVGGKQVFDLVGAFLSFSALFALLLAVIQGQAWGWASVPIIGLLVLFAILGTWFVVVELRKSQPMLELRLFKIRAFSGGNFSLLIAYAAMFTATFLLPFFLEQGQGFSPLKSGLLLTPIPLTTLIVAPLSGSLSDRIGERLPATLGLGIMAIGLYLLTALHAGMSNFDLIWRLMVIGIGQGMFSSPNSSAILGSVPRFRVGTAAATLAQMRTNGQVLGIAAGGAIVASRLPVHLAELAHRLAPAILQRDAFILAIHDAFLVAAVVCALSIITSLARGPSDHDESRDASAAEALPAE